MDDLGTKIDKVLSEHPSGLKAIRIAQLIASTRTEVNSYLYKNKNGRYKFNENNYTWRLSTWANVSSDKEKQDIESSFSKKELESFDSEIFI